MIDPHEAIAAAVTDAHLINGQWCRTSGDRIPVVDPSNQNVLAYVPRGASDEVDEAVSAASRAFPAWRNLNPARRAELLRRWGELVRRQRL